MAKYSHMTEQLAQNYLTDDLEKVMLSTPRTMRVAFLYTESELTPWKENVNEETLLFLCDNAPAGVVPSIITFDGFSEALLQTLKNFDLVFNLCYGFMDAGQVEVADWLSANGILHTASAPDAMRLAQDKALLPEICSHLGLHTPEILPVVEALADEELYLRKPRFGSCHRDIEIENGAWFKAKYSGAAPDFLLQPYIRGREFSVAVVPQCTGIVFESLPPVEIYPENGEDIYTAGKAFGKTNRQFYPDITKELEIDLKRAAWALHHTMKLSGMSRTDFRVDADGIAYVLDVNALPNLDPVRSLMPAICQHAGIPIEELIDRTIKNTLWRHRQRAGQELPQAHVFA